MTNQRRLADNVSHYKAGHTGVPRKGSALLQGIAICGRNLPQIWHAATTSAADRKRFLASKDCDMGAFHR
jgi:hypothetical protein